MAARIRVSTADPRLLATAEAWLKELGEIAVLVRYPYAAGNRDILLITEMDRLTELLAPLRRRTSVILFRQRQLPWRGIVDDAYIQEVLPHFPDRVESMVLDLDYTRPPDFLWATGGWSRDIGRDEQEELREELEDLRGHQCGGGAVSALLGGERRHTTGPRAG